MGPDPTHFVPRLKAHRLGIRDLPAEVLVLTFSLLHGQDIARCMGVCRCFAGLVDSDVCLQYRIALAQNGMVDGDSSTLLVSERLQRLRQYSSNFRNGIFNHEGLEAHPEYVRQFRNLDWNFSMRANGSASALYGDIVGLECFLSVFTHGSVQAGIQSRRWLMPVGNPGDETRWVRSWAIDRAQDLLVTIEVATIDADAQMSRLLEVRFCSLSGSETARMDHPAATLPCVQVFPPPGSDPTVQIDILSLIIGARYVIWGLCTMIDEVRNHSIEVFNWKTGQMVSRIDFGTQPVDVVPWDDSHLLVIPTDSESPRRLSIYSLSPSAPNRPLRTLQLLDLNLNSGEHVVFHQMRTSLHPPAPEGHFRADPSQSIVLLTHYVRGPSRDEYASHLLIPYATLLAQIDAAVPVDSTDSPGPPAPVPWQDWGAHGCLRLRLRPQHRGIRHISLIPSGSRMPVVAFDGPFASVCMFDVNPLAVRHARTRRDSSDSDSDSKATAIVEDVEAALPGVVDPECAAIPYVVHRFRLPHHAIRAVRMSMTGFTVLFEGIGFEETEQTWTV